MSQSPIVDDDESDFYDENEHDGNPDAEQPAPALARQTSAVPDSPGSVALYEDSPVPPPAPQQAPLPAAKRRLSPDLDGDGETTKRRKTVLMQKEQYYQPALPATAGLPAELWQNIFMYFAPDDLSRCLRVNRAFNIYLTRLNSNMSIRLPPRRTALKVLDSELIWSSSRKLFAPNLPRPLSDLSEMQMFQLIGGKFCQLCGASATQKALQSSNGLAAGPGPHGVRIIWSFFARLCGSCFESQSLKDVEVLVDPVARELKPGLPHAFRTNELHYIPATLAATSGHALKGAMHKVYYRKHIDDLQQEHKNAKEFGDAAAEEWVKGLPGVGKQLMADAGRWERWESLQPHHHDLGRVLREYFQHSSAPAVGEAPTTRASTQSATSLQTMKHPLPNRPVAATTLAPAVSAQQSATLNGAAHMQRTGQESQQLPQSHKKQLRQPQHQQQQQQQTHQPRTQQEQQVQLSQQPQQSEQMGQLQASWHQPRSFKEVQEARSARRAEIERRCMEEFMPPLMPCVLDHMESFRAAMQITQPLTDQTWELLKQRLLDQRDSAEQEEYVRQEQLRALQATMPNSYREQLPAANEAADRQRDQNQASVRQQLAHFADEMVRGKWNNGKGLNKETAPVFAVEVLLYSRNKFVEAHTPAGQPAAETHSITDPAFVSLENMRWLFDNKVRPITEKYIRDLFHCADCDPPTKALAFEGLIQHFGARHTEDFSLNNITVHWSTAEWPEESPLVPVVGEANPTMPDQPSSHALLSATPAANNPSGQVIPAGQVNHSTSNSPDVLGHQLSQAPAWFDGPAFDGQTQAEYAAYGYQHGPAYGQYGWYPYPAQQPTSMHEAQIIALAKITRDVWESTADVKDLYNGVRMQTVLHHTVARFKALFGMEPSMDLLTDALSSNVLSTNVLMRPIKEPNDIACRACIESSAAVNYPYSTRMEKSKHFNISSLVAHFKIIHLSQDPTAYDWKSEMIEVPEPALIQALMVAVGMDDDKLTLIAEAFPGVFPNPLPRIGKVLEHIEPLPLLPKKKSKNKRQKNKQRHNDQQNRAAIANDDENASDTMPEAPDDEYDPRRPAIVEPPPDRRPSQSRRSLGDAHASAEALPIDPRVEIVMTPETIAALSKLASSLQPQQSSADRRSAEKAEEGMREHNASAYAKNRSADYHPADPAFQPHAALKRQQQTRQEQPHGRDDQTHNRVSKKARRSGGKQQLAERESADEAEEDYTQIIRKPAVGAHDDAQHPGMAISPTAYSTTSRHAPASHAQAVQYIDAYGRPVEAPPQSHGQVEIDQYGRTIEHLPPAPRGPYDYEYRDAYAYDRPVEREIHHVDQYGRVVQVVRVVERHGAHPTPTPAFAPPPHHTLDAGHPRTYAHAPPPHPAYDQAYDDAGRRIFYYDDPRGPPPSSVHPPQQYDGRDLRGPSSAMARPEAWAHHPMAAVTQQQAPHGYVHYAPQREYAYDDGRGASVGR